VGKRSAKISKKGVTKPDSDHLNPERSNEYMDRQNLTPMYELPSSQSHKIAVSYKSHALAFVEILSPLREL